MIRGLLIDMDGVVYRGGQLVPGADRFIEVLHESGIPFLFLTNNSQPYSKYKQKLQWSLRVLRKASYTGIKKFQMSGEF
ncbi:MAG: hypothetical protein AAF492_33085 [Verrucomicrobiota bacterium]